MSPFIFIREMKNTVSHPRRQAFCVSAGASMRCAVWSRSHFTPVNFTPLAPCGEAEETPRMLRFGIFKWCLLPFFPCSSFHCSLYACMQQHRATTPCVLFPVLGEGILFGLQLAPPPNPCPSRRHPRPHCSPTESLHTHAPPPMPVTIPVGPAGQHSCRLLLMDWEREALRMALRRHRSGEQQQLARAVSRANSPRLGGGSGELLFVSLHTSLELYVLQCFSFHHFKCRRCPSANSLV